MGLPWVRLDTTFHHNPKVLDLAARGKYRAAFAYVCSLAYAGQHGTDGYTTRSVPGVHPRDVAVTPAYPGVRDVASPCDADTIVMEVIR